MHINSVSDIKQKNCPSCGIVFSCGIKENEDGCWCNQFPAIFLVSSNTGCLCPDCLKKEAIRRIHQYVGALRPEEAFSNKAKDLPPTQKQLEDIDFYREHGNYVFTAWYHLKRGYCCQNGCRHCPYGFKK